MQSAVRISAFQDGQKVLSKLNVLPRASQREEVQPLNLVAVAVLDVKTAPGTRLALHLCSKVLNTCRFLGRGVTCFSGGSDVNESEAKSNRKMSGRCWTVTDCSTACWSASRARCGSNITALSKYLPQTVLQSAAIAAPCPLTAGVQLGALVVAAPSLRNAWGLLVSDLFHKIP